MLPPVPLSIYFGFLVLFVKHQFYQAVRISLPATVLPFCCCFLCSSTRSVFVPFVFQSRFDYFSTLSSNLQFHFPLFLIDFAVVLCSSFPSQQLLCILFFRFARQ